MDIDYIYRQEVHFKIVVCLYQWLSIWCLNIFTIQSQRKVAGTFLLFFLEKKTTTKLDTCNRIQIFEM